MIAYNGFLSGLTKVHYDGHDLSMVYLGNHKVYPTSTPPPTPSTYRFKAKKTDDTEVYSYCDGQYSGYDRIMQSEIKDVVGGADIFEAIDSISSIDFGSCPSLSGVSFGVGIHTNTSITSVTFTNSSITNLGTSTFSGYKSLKDIIISDCITSMGDSVFYNSGLKSVTIGSGLSEIALGTFASTPLSAVTLPSNITKIGEKAFQACSALTSVTIENNSVELGDKAFGDCRHLYNFDFSNINKIGNSAFTNCTSLTSITIPSNVTQIGTTLFKGCSNLKTATIPTNILPAYTFANCTSLSSVTLPNSANTIGEGAFSGCTSLTDFNYTNVATYNINAFNGCTSLSAVNLTNATTIGENAFLYTSLSNSLNMPNIESIGMYAFRNLTGLTDVTIGENCLSIGVDAFKNCSGLTAITINATNPPLLDSGVFYNTGNCPIYCPCESLSLYQQNWAEYASRLQCIPTPSYQWVSYASGDTVPTATTIYGVRIYPLYDSNYNVTFSGSNGDYIRLYPDGFSDWVAVDENGTSIDISSYRIRPGYSEYEIPFSDLGFGGMNIISPTTIFKDDIDLYIPN